MAAAMPIHYGEVEDQNNPEDVPLEGWLSKRSKVLHNWKRCYFSLRGNVLTYSDSQSGTRHLKTIPLTGCIMVQSEIDKKPFVFRLQAKGSKRAYYISTSSEEEMNNWMQAIVMARGTAAGDKSEACVVQ